MATEQETIAYLRSPQAIRERCGQLFDLALQDQLTHFRCDLNQLDRTADYVIDVIQTAYPNGHIPFHSRWRHFEVGSSDRLARFNQALAILDPIEQARIRFDLAITSVLLDAGAGADWKFVEPDTLEAFARSEGLAVASFHLFEQGGFSSDPHRPWQADAIGLEQFTVADLAAGFQVTDQNPLVGLEGRVELLQRLGKTLRQSPHLFGQALPRPGYLVDYLLSRSQNGRLPAAQVLEAVLTGLSDIWPGRETIGGVNLGDVWQHPTLPPRGLGSQLVPFHKLSQWLTYSLLEPLQALGLEIVELDELTGLAEYRNGGLCVDLGLLQPKQAGVLNDRHLPGSPVIVEWRALTICLIDRIAERVRQKLGLSPTEFPLVKVLEGGTWAAGRKIAAELRSNGSPPIQIISDGTVF